MHNELEIISVLLFRVLNSIMFFEKEKKLHFQLSHRALEVPIPRIHLLLILYSFHKHLALGTC